MLSYLKTYINGKIIDNLINGDNMGCIRTKDIKKASFELIKKYPGKFTKDFEKNKQIIKELDLVPEKGARNKVAGYLVRAVEKTEKRKI